ncbi:MULTISPECIES: hypothetical protein [Deinococcus]|uniref:Uncharacterized protein n=2 Tax=Deinococcus soli (ex Cha et al. 2016) TaxID=1309411 RepID=A0ACC6KDY8_9DEIO|nr:MULTISPECIES: hypothetical protein [Deinococcus]MDK2011604.1 hypothetical protein [Deinococcus sp. 43]MDR6217216.1 hypothetical protein [Deinococcus soli (ex Cha et al. 2016)]MDR6326525.1 hypothetical protein [Deinococcus soli (ex Cha et al. 2016)]MDR6750748.1 hypothetical protein [Deinococcus soli (ex Cha et al. 2016)]GGB57752.1 hypothetical protein GCM10008019_12130 [Deinococcus soli (ex Cha et al. 2016)]
MSNLKRLITAAATVLLLSAPALASDEPPPSPKAGDGCIRTILGQVFCMAK